MATNRLMSAFFRKRLAEGGLDLTAEQWGVLCQLWNGDRVTQDMLAATLCTEKSSLSRVLDVLERKGLVRRERDPADARKKILFATPESEALQKTCRKVAEESMAELLRDCDPGELETCLKVLRQVRHSLKRLSAENAP